MATPNLKSAKMKHQQTSHPRRIPKQVRERYPTLTTRIKDVNYSEVFDGSWPDSDTINFLRHGLTETGR